MYRILSCILLLALHLHVFAAARTPTPIIIDTDMASDDWVALLFLAHIPEVDIKAITVTGAGEATCEKGVENALKLIEKAGKPNIPVICGRPERLEGGNLFPATWRIQMDSLLGFELPLPAKPAPTPANAVELLHHVIQASPTKITVLTLGPLTNIADLFSLYPQDKNKIEIVAMIGAFFSDGNVYESTGNIENRKAEWNAFADALALKQVVKSGVKITMVGLDATRHVPLTEEFFNGFKQLNVNASGKFVYDLLSHGKDFAKLEGWYFWDPLAACVVFAPDMFEFKNTRIQVLTNPLAVRGQTKVMPHGTQVRVAVKADAEKFKKIFFKAFQESTP